MDENQESRLERIFYDEFYLLDALGPHESGDVIGCTIKTFKISGSTRSLYTVVFRKNGRFDCDCMDMKLHCRKIGCVCKHICFVYIKVLKLAGFEFFCENGNVLPEAKVKEAETICGALNGNIDAMLLNMSLKDKYDMIKSGKYTMEDSFQPNKAIGEDDDCPICYNPLSDGILNGCPVCKNVVHKKCIKKWLDKHDTCVYCRSDIWRMFNIDGLVDKGKKSGGYIQL